MSGDCGLRPRSVRRLLFWKQTFQRVNTTHTGSANIQSPDVKYIKTANAENQNGENMEMGEWGTFLSLIEPFAVNMVTIVLKEERTLGQVGGNV